MPPQRKRRRKSGKYAPLVWILTAAVIAFFIGYSNTFKNLSFLQNNPQSGASSASSEGNNTFNLTNLFPPSVSSAPVSNAVSQASSSPGPISNVSQQLVKVKIYLASKNDKEISLVEKTVMLPKSQSLLKDTLQYLINYNDPKLINLVPIKTKIRKITIRNGIALIDLSDDFAYNSYGVIGYKVQVYQVVYTAAQFKKVDAVAFYIDGRLADYLGGDGYPVHNPVYPFSNLPRFPLE
ncbi:MAG: GerMN domain-containing protein [Brevinematales bacterium]|jgi:spore germination protein GerM